LRLGSIAAVEVCRHVAIAQRVFSPDGAEVTFAPLDLAKIVAGKDEEMKERYGV
jgi:hypothetical protein